MSYDTFPNIRFELPIVKNPTFPIIENQFGMGYSQISGDGLNREQIIIELKFGNINAVDRDILNRFIAAHGAIKTFAWTAPGDTELKLWRFVNVFAETIRTHTGNPADPYYYDRVLKFKRVYG